MEAILPTKKTFFNNMKNFQLIVNFSEFDFSSIGDFIITCEGGDIYICEEQEYIGLDPILWPSISEVLPTFIINLLRYNAIAHIISIRYLNSFMD